MSTLPDFPTFFHALHNHDPFPWQTMLAERVAAGAWPEVLDLRAIGRVAERTGGPALRLRGALGHTTAG